MDLTLLTPGKILSMTATAAQRLVASGDGGAALLYLALLDGCDQRDALKKTLGWSDETLEKSWRVLRSLDLIATEPPQAPPTVVQPLPADEPPVYEQKEILQRAEQDSSFAFLLEETQRRLGKILSGSELKSLYTMYDFMALPTEVILLLITWCIGLVEEKHGEGRRPTMPQIRREAARWHRSGIDTAEAADAHLKQLSSLRARERELLPLLDIYGRLPITAERNYINGWVDMGFDDSAIRLAYEKTVLKKQSLNWPYMNSILKNWHQKGMHTVVQVKAGDSNFPKKRVGQGPMANTAQGPADRRAQEGMERMRRFMEQQTQEEE